MTNKIESILELSPCEIKNVSGAFQYNPLPLNAVVTIGLSMAVVSGIVIYPTGSILALGTCAVITLSSYYINGEDWDKSIRLGVITETVATIAIFGLTKLQHQKNKHQHNI